VELTVGLTQQHESASADVTGSRVYDCQREAGCYGCIHRVAALPQNGNSYPGGFLVDAHNHAVFGMDRTQTLSKTQRRSCHEKGNYLKNKTFA
jgi:hypothetical protein